MIPVCEPELGDAEYQNVMDAVERGFISGTTGKYIDEFESRFSSYCGVEHGVATTSGTTALHLTMEALDLGRGDEVIVPDITNAATVFAPVYANATPVTVDVDRETWGMDPEDVKEKMTPDTAAIAPVHLYGHPVDMDPILDLAEDHGLFVVEDCAEAHGAEYKGQRVGSFGHAACFSFYANKVVTTGEGGMVITDDDDLDERLRLLRNLAFDPERRFRHNEVGYNYRMSNVQAAIGAGQMERIDEIVEGKRELARKYMRHLSGVEGLTLPVERDWAKNVYWMFCLLVEDEAHVSRDELKPALAEEGIDTRTFFLQMSQQKAFTDMGLFADTTHETAAELSERGLYLPSGLSLTDDEIELISETVERIVTGTAGSGR